MDATTWIALAGVGLGGLGTGGAIYSVVRQVRREHREDRRRTEADVTARTGSRPWPRHPEFTDHFIVIENRGPALANQVVARFSLGDDQRVLGAEDDDTFTTDTLDSGQTVELPLILSMGSSGVPSVSLTWVDGAGAKRKELTLHA